MPFSSDSIHVIFFASASERATTRFLLLHDDFFDGLLYHNFSLFTESDFHTFKSDGAGSNLVHELNNVRADSSMARLVDNGPLGSSSLIELSVYTEDRNNILSFSLDMLL